MNGYADLPNLVPVMDTILGYLSVKERTRCKGVCSSWRQEIKRREKKSNTLVLHGGPYLWNFRWSHTNNHGLMKFENSFEMETTTFLWHQRTRSLLKRIKKLAILNVPLDPTDLTEAHLNYFKCCEEIEFRNVHVRQGTLTFDLPKLKVLVLKDCPVSKLTLNCPSLEVLFWTRQLERIDFQNVKKLKRLICFDWPATVSLNGKFVALEYLNFFAIGRMNDGLLNLLLGRIPNLKRFVFYSDDPQADLKSIRRQQKRYGLKNLEVLFNGFRKPVQLALSHVPALISIDKCIDQLFDHYSELVENSPWKVWIDYSQLFSKFKELPSNFFERFSQCYAIEIREVTNYTHLFGFLKCYPFVQQLYIHWSKVKAHRILDMVHLLQPSLIGLTIVEERPSELLEIDLSFLSRLLNLVNLRLESTHLPIAFLERVVIRRGAHLQKLEFDATATKHNITVSFISKGILLYDTTCRSKLIVSPSIEQLIPIIQSDPHLSAFFL